MKAKVYLIRVNFSRQELIETINLAFIELKSDRHEIRTLLNYSLNDVKFVLVRRFKTAFEMEN